MKNTIILILLNIISHLAYSQKITIANLEKVVKMNLYDTDLSLSSVGFSYEKTDSNEICKFHIFSKDKFDKIEDYSTVIKSFCEEIYKIQFSVFDKSIYNSLREEALKSNYKLIKTTTDESGLKSTFININTNFLIDFTQGKLKTESKTYTQYFIELYCRKTEL